MKKTIFNLLFLVALAPIVAFGNNDKKKHEKSKTIKKEFNVNSDATVAIKNKYGTVDVKTWDKNRVEIEIKITVKGNNLEKVEQRLERIDVLFDANSNFVEAKTIIDKNKSSWSWWGKNNNISYQINYLVKMPVTNNANLSNDYGNIYLNELKGKADISCDYGKIAVGDLLNSSNSISLDYCSKSSISYMKSGTVDVDYSKLTIDESKNVKLNSDYSTLEFGKLDKLNFNSDYGSVTVGDANAVEGSVDYVSIKLGTIRKSVKLTSDYGSIKIKNLMNGFDFVDINSEYAGIRIGTEANANFNFVIDLSYAGFKYEGNVDVRKSIEKSSKKHYEGTFGKGSSSTIKIRSSYGGVSIKEN